MQVKKFEAKTMKEALELIKTQLGPEAIILSAKDTHRGFGLMGEKSVEVTAAVSDETLRKKKIAESKLREDLRERFNQIPATKQKEFINKAFHAQVEERKRELAHATALAPVSNESRARAKGLRYIDIEDEAEVQERGADRVRVAVERAKAGIDIFQETRTRKVNPQPSRQSVHQPNTEIVALEAQVHELKALVEKFQKIPQVPMSMHPGAEQGLPFELSGMYQRLTGQGVRAQFVAGILKKAQKEMDRENIKKPAMVDAWMVRHILDHTEVVKNSTAGRYHIFMGCTGQGKTTTLVKFASHLILKEKKTIAIVSLDNQKVGAADQLRIYAQILNVPFAIVRNADEWRVAEQKLKNVQHILVDCPGSNLKTMEEVEWIKQMIPPLDFDRRIHFVQSILARDEETMNIASRYQMIGFHDVIFTRLDESAQQGLVLNFQERFKVPLHSFGFGSRIPEDYEIATKERVVDFIFKLSRVTKREDN